ncbi:MAG: Rv2993c-like domain-containing protein, partial [bacterium]
MKWLRFRFADREGLGVLDGEHVRVCEGDLFAAPQPTGEVLPLAQIEWLPPVRPSKSVGLRTYVPAAAATHGWAVPAEPLYVLKSPGSLTAHGATVPE